MKKTLAVITIFIVLFFAVSVVIAKDRTFRTRTKNYDVSDIKQVEIVLEEPKAYMDSSVHTLNSIDLEIHQLLKTLNAITAKITWWEELREQVLIEAEKVKLRQ